jgi:hypothetical protein
MMQVNLRKANAIQSEIRKAINAVKTEVSVSVSEFTPDIEKAVTDAQTEFLNAVKRKEQLNAVLFEIRSAVGRANVQSGVSDLLAEVQNVDAKMTIFTTVSSATAAKTVDELKARVEKLKSTSSEQSARMAVYGERYNNVETSVVSQSVLDKFKAEVKTLKRAKQDLQDKLLNLNVATTIALSANSVSVLKEEGIL